MSSNPSFTTTNSPAAAEVTPLAPTPCIKLKLHGDLCGEYFLLPLEAVNTYEKLVHSIHKLWPSHSGPTSILAFILRRASGGVVSPVLWRWFLGGACEEFTVEFVNPHDTSEGSAANRRILELLEKQFGNSEVADGLCNTSVAGNVEDHEGEFTQCWAFGLRCDCTEALRFVSPVWVAVEDMLAFLCAEVLNPPMSIDQLFAGWDIKYEHGYNEKRLITDANVRLREIRCMPRNFCKLWFERKPKFGPVNPNIGESSNPSALKGPLDTTDTTLTSRSPASAPAEETGETEEAYEDDFYLCRPSPNLSPLAHVTGGVLPPPALPPVHPEKPVITFYPPSVLQATVKLTLGPGYSFTYLNPPPFNVHPFHLPSLCFPRSVASWPRLTLYPSGHMATSTGLPISYLFWESSPLPSLSLSSSPLSENSSQTFCVELTEWATWADCLMIRLGFPARERQDMVTAFGPKFRTRWVVIRVLKREEVEGLARIEVEPKEQRKVRIFVVLRGSTKRIKTDGKIEKVVDELLEGKGRPKVGTEFVVFEWGGAVLRDPEEGGGKAKKSGEGVKIRKVPRLLGF